MDQHREVLFLALSLPLVFHRFQPQLPPWQPPGTQYSSSRNPQSGVRQEMGEWAEKQGIRSENILQIKSGLQGPGKTDSSPTPEFHGRQTAARDKAARKMCLASKEYL